MINWYTYNFFYLFKCEFERFISIFLYIFPQSIILTQYHFPRKNIKIRSKEEREEKFLSSFTNILAMPYSPTKRIRSTIGAGGLNFCVRNGYRCDPSAIITRKSFFLLFSLSEFFSSSSRFPQNYSMYNLLQPFFLPWSSPRPISIS